MTGPAFKIEVDKLAPDLTAEDLLYFCACIKGRAGLHLKQSKQELVRSRLRSRLVVHGLKSFSEYRSFLQSLPDNDPEWGIFTNLLTTNKTDFFREPQHFDYLVNHILPAWLKTGERTFTAWSAASSTGEEAYTLAMLLRRALPLGRDFRIHATDIDSNVLSVASNAVYPIAKRREVPLEYHQSCIDLGRRDADGWFRIKPHLKEKVSFGQYNLIKPSNLPFSEFDLVLCRNVLIYFDRDTVDLVQRHLYSKVKDGGHLFIGHSESLQGMAHTWTPTEPSIFRKDR